MNTYVHTVTEIERVCGVTLEDVARVLPQAYTFGDSIMLPIHTSAALSSSVARCAFAGSPIEFSHLKNGYPVYRKVA